jgi:hypothetical protein
MAPNSMDGACEEFALTLDYGGDVKLWLMSQETPSIRSSTFSEQGPSECHWSSKSEHFIGLFGVNKMQQVTMFFFFSLSSCHLVSGRGAVTLIVYSVVF